MPLDGFVQVKLDPKKPIGVPPEELQEFLAECDWLDYLNIMGLSTMGSAEFDPESKKAEFKKLKELRNTYLPHGLISAWTSRDYDIALEERVDVVRVGQDIWQ